MSVEEISPPVKRALISVSDKSGLIELAKELDSKGVQIYSTGGTRRHLVEAGMTVHDISEYTQFPEMMDGRLKTLHPKVFGGILARHNREDDLQGLNDHGIHTFELVVVNLYPFQQTIAREGVTDAEAIEQIDIGGPSLVRAAAKNHAFITIATCPSQYEAIAAEIAETGSTTLATRRKLAAAAFAKTADYDSAIANYFIDSAPASEEWPGTISASWQRVSTLRYGENPHQRAALYSDSGERPSVLSAEQLNGKELSYNNYLDLDAALSIVRGFNRAAVSVIKHNNPCGVACGDSIAEATEKAMAGDPTSAFGSILGSNRIVDAAMAEVLAKPGLFVEAIVAPEFSPEAVEILTTKPKWKKNVRLMQLGTEITPTSGRMIRPIDGGILVQDADTGKDAESEWKIVTSTHPTDQQLAELRFAWEVVRHVKSNAIVLTRDQSLVGNGAGQMSRVDAVEIAIRKAAERSQGSVLASDAFFPFPDSIEHAAQAGVVAVIQPGGSKNDELVINACNEHGLAMIMTGRRHFRH
ncbi:MAG: bifunctional phosphoribosylaminoimidazolecarboxamide formyltransferase/IMP cyclohydrolase [Planctomycetota bacterium]